MGAIVKNGINYTNSSSPTKTSELVNDSGFITKAVNDLVNYYLKSETYSKAEVDAIATAIKNSRFEAVQTLPTTDIKTNVIYLVPSADPQAQNVKDEYINTDGTTSGWEIIGSTSIDLSGYVTTTDLNTALADYVTSTGLATILADYVESTDLATVATSGDYDDLINKPSIPTVSATQILSTGTKIGSVTVDSTTTEFFAPSGGGGTGTDENAYHVDDTTFTAIDDADFVPIYDTSTSTAKKSTWSNIKSVLKTYFDTIYSTVKSRGTATSGGTTLSLVNTGDMYTWNNKASAPTIKTATLSAGSTSVSFSNVPTTGNKLISIYTSKIGLDYISMSGTSTVTVTFPAQTSAVTVYMKIEDV